MIYLTNEETKLIEKTKKDFLNLTQDARKKFLEDNNLGNNSLGPEGKHAILTLISAIAAIILFSGFVSIFSAPVGIYVMFIGLWFLWWAVVNR